MFLAMICFPSLGILAARYWRPHTRVWFAVHFICQVGCIIYLLLGAYFGVQLVSSHGGSHFSTPHTILGPILCCLAVFNFFIGFVVRGCYPSMRNLAYCHRLVGTGVFFGSWIMMFLGLSLFPFSTYILQLAIFFSFLLFGEVLILMFLQNTPREYIRILLHVLIFLTITSFFIIFSAYLAIDV